MFLAKLTIFHEFKAYLNTLILKGMVINAVAFGALKFYDIFL